MWFETVLFDYLVEVQRGTLAQSYINLNGKEYNFEQFVNNICLFSVRNGLHKAKHLLQVVLHPLLYILISDFSDLFKSTKGKTFKRF